MYDVVDRQKVSEAHGTLAVVVVEAKSEVELISINWTHIVNSFKHSLSVSHITCLFFRQKALEVLVSGLAEL